MHKCPYFCIFLPAALFTISVVCSAGLMSGFLCNFVDGRLNRTEFYTTNPLWVQTIIAVLSVHSEGARSRRWRKHLSIEQKTTAFQGKHWD